jgi:hypothetical protein
VTRSLPRLNVAVSPLGDQQGKMTKQIRQWQTTSLGLLGEVKEASTSKDSLRTAIRPR